MKLEKHKPKCAGESYNKLEVINSRGTKKLIELLNYEVSLDGEKKTLGQVIEYVHENGKVYTDEKVKALEDKIIELENKLIGHLETQKVINENLYEAIKDGGVI